MNIFKIIQNMKIRNNYVFVMITLFVAFSNAFGIDERFPREVDLSCGPPANISSYCSDCKTQVLCGTEGEISYTTCPDTSVCEQVYPYGFCEVDTEVPECACPSTGSTRLPDPYDDQKFLVCVNGDLHIETCEGDLYFNPDTLFCGNRPTTTVEPTTISYCEGVIFGPVKISCTEYSICYPNGSSSGVLECPPGELFDEVTESCQFYETFSCSFHEGETGFYGDPSNCSVYYACDGGEQVGVATFCDEGQVFDDTDKVCTDDLTKCHSIVDCGICKDGPMLIPIDCTRYYQCTRNSDGYYEPILRTCPVGTYFDPVYGYCQAEVEGCPNKSIPSLSKNHFTFLS